MEYDLSGTTFLGARDTKSTITISDFGITDAEARIKLNSNPLEKYSYLTLMLYLIGDAVSRFHYEAREVYD